MNTDPGIRLLHHLIDWDGTLADDVNALEMTGKKLQPKMFWEAPPRGLELEPTAMAHVVEMCVQHWRTHGKRIPLEELNSRIRELKEESQTSYGEAQGIIPAAKQASSNASDIENIIDAIVVQYKTRAYQSAVLCAASDGENAKKDPDAARQRLLNRLESINDATVGTSDMIVTANERKSLNDRAALYVERMQQKDGYDTGRLYSGFKALDSRTGGFSTGQVLVVAAQPKTGKSAFCLSAATQMLLTAEEHGAECDVMIANREMRQEDQQSRLEAYMIWHHPEMEGIDTVSRPDKRGIVSRIQQGKLTDVERKQYLETLNSLDQLENQIHIADSRAYGTLDELEGIVSGYKRRRPGLKVLYVDACNDQRLSRYGKFVDNQYQALGAVVSRLMDIAHHQDVFVIAEVQEKRAISGTRHVSLPDLYADSSRIAWKLSHALRLYSPEENDRLVEAQFIGSRHAESGWSFPLWFVPGDMFIQEAPMSELVKIGTAKPKDDAGKTMSQDWA